MGILVGGCLVSAYRLTRRNQSRRRRHLARQPQSVVFGLVTAWDLPMSRGCLYSHSRLCSSPLWSASVRRGIPHGDRPRGAPTRPCYPTGRGRVEALIADAERSVQCKVIQEESQRCCWNGANAVILPSGACEEKWRSGGLTKTRRRAESRSPRFLGVSAICLKTCLASF